MAISVSVYTSDCEPRDAERRIAHVTASGACRVAVVSLSGGMMDIGWAQRLFGSGKRRGRPLRLDRR